MKVIHSNNINELKNIINGIGNLTTSTGDLINTKLYKLNQVKHPPFDMIKAFFNLEVLEIHIYLSYFKQIFI